MTEPHASPSEPVHAAVSRSEGLSVPEHVWFDAAIEALGREDAPAQRLAALRMLKQAPRSWDAVMMVGLTTQDVALQLGALEALASHVRLDPLRRAGFARLGKLTVWQPVAREAWELAWRELGGVAEGAAAWRAVEGWDGGSAVEEVVAEAAAAPPPDESPREREVLRREADGLRSEMEALRVACQLAEERLATQVEAARQLELQLAEARRAPEGRREDLLQSLREREAELEALAEIAWKAERDRRRWALGAACGSLLAAGIIAALVVGRAPALASEPNGRVKALAEADGYRKAIVALAAEASRLEADGDVRGAAGAWGCISRIATGSDDGLASHAAVRLRELSAAAPAEQSPAARPVREAPEVMPEAEGDRGFQAAPVVRAPRVVRAERVEPVVPPIRRAQGAPRPSEARDAFPRRIELPKRVVVPARPVVRKDAEPGEGSFIPDDVRAKFDEP